MSGNGVGYGAIRYHHNLLQAALWHCEQCGGWLPDHDWADLNDQDRVVECSGVAR